MRAAYHPSPHLHRTLKFCFLLVVVVPDFWCQSNSTVPVTSNYSSNPPVLNNSELSTTRPVTNHYSRNPPVLNNSEWSTPRPVKDEDEMTNFLNHSVIVAHITNGITLLAGLMDKSIPIDDAVGELLNFGSVSLSQIRNFQSDKVTDLTNKLNVIPSKLKEEKDIIAAEQKALKFIELSTAPPLAQNAKEILHYDDYFNELLDGISKSYLKTSVHRSNMAFNIIENILTNISRTKLDSMGGTNETVYLFQNILTYFKSLFERTDDLKKEVRALQSKRAKYEEPTYFEPLATLVYLRNVRKSIVGVDDNGLSKEFLEDNVNVVYQHIEDMKIAGNEVQMMQLLIGNRVHSMSAKKRHTPGFPAGIADVKQLEKDVNDSWISKILNISELDDFQKLAEGLLPLFTASVEIKSLDDKLTLVSTSTIYKSLLDIAIIHNETSTMTRQSFNMSEVLDKYSRCAGSAKNDKSDMKPAEDFLKNTSLLKNSLDSITDYLSTFNVSEMKEEFEKFYSTLGFKDLRNITQSLIDLPIVITNLDTQALDSLKGRVSNAKQSLNNSTKTDISALLKSMKNGKATLYGLENVLDDELSILKCLKEIEEQCSNMAKALHVIQKLRPMDMMMLTKVRHVAASIANVSRSLENIEMLPAQMRKEANTVTEKIVKLPDAAMNLDMIVQSTNSLRYAYDLRKLEPSISLLKIIDRTVREEISKLLIPKDRTRVSEQWGKNHSEDMAQLDAALAAVKAFSSKLNTANAKTIGDYGTSLTELAKIPDVQINASEKSKALQTLIDRNPDIKSHLKPIKDTLDVIASLDLQFSSHKDQIENAPSAFRAIHDFLTRVTIYSDANLSIFSRLFWMWILLGVFLSLRFVIVVTFVVWVSWKLIKA